MIQEFNSNFCKHPPEKNKMPDKALANLKVLDLTHHIAGPFCSRMLADLGASVIKIEKPGTGDGMRKIGPFAGGSTDPEKSLPFHYYNFNKKGITLNLTTKEGVNIFRKLIEKADILVENFEPRVLPGLGLAYETLEKINPGIILTSISNFGQTGSYRDYKATDLVAYALGGMLFITGAFDRKPIKHGLSQAQILAGMNAVVGTMTARHWQRLTGAGQHVDISIMESVVAMQGPHPVSYSYHGGIMRRQTATWGATHRIAPCKDGHISPLLEGGSRTWEEFVAFIGMDEFNDPKFSDPAGRFVNGNELYGLLKEALANRTKKEIFEAAQEWRFPWAMVQTPENLANCDQLNSREFFIDIEHPKTGKATYPGPMCRMSKTPWQAVRPAPLLGQHNEDIYGGLLGYDRDELARMKDQGII
jgi:CoA:oxalate CoA-transferase